MNSAAQTHLSNLDVAVHPALNTHPSKLFVEVTTKCNLRCPMCPKQAPGNGIVNGDMRTETFNCIKPALSGFKALILNGIGEPLLHPSLERFIAAAKQQMPADAWVGFQTNGQLLYKDRACSLVDAGIDKVCISSDAVTPNSVTIAASPCVIIRNLRISDRTATSVPYPAARASGAQDYFDASSNVF